MEERESKGGMGEENKRGQTAYTLISPGIAVPVSLKVRCFCLCTDPTDFDIHVV